CDHTQISHSYTLALHDALPILSEIDLSPNDSTARMLRDEICARLNYLCKVGVGYLTLDRSTRTLSGGEVQRVNLTTCLGASLVKDRKSTRLNSSHEWISYAVFC